MPKASGPNPYAVKRAQTAERMRKKLASQQGEKKICLNMIVRNESVNMPRILDSVKDIIDMISIVDTGSADNTPEVIQKWGKAHNIATTVHHEPFKNFEYNRTHALRMAKKTYPEADYLLLSDADFVWQTDVGAKFDKVHLMDHKYLICQKNKVLSYWNIRLLNNKLDWMYRGVTHEYVTEEKNQKAYAGEVRTNRIHTLVIDDREDGGCKADKYERDERLLRTALADPKTPKDLIVRYHFYLAQTLKDVGRYTESIEWYRKRIEDRGWPEEVYYAKFQIGANYENLAMKTHHVLGLLGKPAPTAEDTAFITRWNPDNLDAAALTAKVAEYVASAEQNYWAAYEYRKVRSESLYYLTRMHRHLNRYDKAYACAKVGKKIAYPKTDTLFIEDLCYDYVWDYEIAVAGLHIPDVAAEGKECLKCLLPRFDMRNDFIESVKSMEKTYDTLKIPTLAKT